MEIKEELLCETAVGGGKRLENKSDFHSPCSQTDGFDRTDITHKPTSREAMNLELSNVLLSVPFGVSYKPDCLSFPDGRIRDSLTHLLPMAL